jgi:hypothetical protein
MGRIYSKRKRAQAALRALGSLAYSAARYLMGPPLVLMSYEVMRDNLLQGSVRKRLASSLAYSAARYLRVRNPPKE